MSEGGLEQQQLVLSSRRKFAKYFFAKKMLSFWCWTNSLYSSFHILLLFVLFLLSGYLPYQSSTLFDICIYANIHISPMTHILSGVKFDFSRR